MTGYVYFMSNRKRGVIYIGVTRPIQQRIKQHKDGETEGFTRRYSVTRLVRVENYDQMIDAIQREKQLKNWKRDWKIALIEQDNPE
jgi:putative endonuclease